MKTKVKLWVTLLLVITLTNTAQLVLCQNVNTVVETEYGKVEGFLQQTQSQYPQKSLATVFLGIPFAKQPVAELRFEKPVDPEKWSGVRKAQNFAAACAPIARIAMYRPLNRSQFSEDCLYLNIIAPAWKSEDKRGFAVLVFVHGGGFQVGHAHQTGYANFVENYLPRDLIVVTIQYRLAQFGFAALDNDDFAGDYGLWDQRAALQFVRRNIARFGGDPSRVTVWGHSAGAASVSHLSVSKHLSGLMTRTIQMSGSAYGEWACSERVIAPTRALADSLNCLDDASNSKVVKECLKTKSTDEILDAAEQIGERRKDDLNFIFFTARVDGKFHTQNLTESIALAPKIPTLIGLTDLEAVLFTVGGVIKELTDLYIAPEEYGKFSEETFRNFVTNFIVNDKRLTLSVDELQIIRERIFDFYIRDADKHDHSHSEHSFGSEAVPRDANFYMRQQIKLISDVMFLVPILMEAHVKASQNWPMFLYRFSYVNPELWYDGRLPIIASTHSGEYPYIFALPPTAPSKFNSNDRVVKEHFLDVITGFAKTGNPTPIVLSDEGIQWPRLGPLSTSLEHVQIDVTPSVHDNSQFMAETLKFWREMKAEFDFVDIHAFDKIEKVLKNEL